MGARPPSLCDCANHRPVGHPVLSSDSEGGLPGRGVPPLTRPRGFVAGPGGDASLPVAILRLPLVPSLVGHCPPYGLYDPVVAASFF